MGDGEIMTGTQFAGDKQRAVVGLSRRRDAAGWLRLPVWLLGALWVVGALALLTLAVLAHSRAQFPGDAGITAFIQRFRQTPLAPIINFPSDINEPLPGGVLLALIVGALALLRRGIEAIVTAVASLGGDLLNALLNARVARPRPHNIHVKTISGLGAHSFPSGHVEHVTVLFGFLLFLTLLARSARPDRWAWLLPVQIVCIYFIALVGVGRIMERAHQPSDVLAGYLMGVLLLPLAILLYRWLGAWWHHRQECHQRHKAIRRVDFSG
jgi:membrane-associated phospholipid phosphatase